MCIRDSSYAMRIAEVALEMGINPRKDLKVKTLVLGSEDVYKRQHICSSMCSYYPAGGYS